MVNDLVVFGQRLESHDICKCVHYRREHNYDGNIPVTVGIRDIPGNDGTITLGDQTFETPDYIADMLSHDKIRDYGIFNPITVEKLHTKCRRMADKRISFKDNMSFIGILSTQLLINNYLDNFRSVSSLADHELKVLIDRS